MAASRLRAGNERGMTLIEVMVALAVLAIALLAVVQSVTESTRIVGGLRERTFASWIANNIIVELQVNRTWSTDTVEDEREFAGREWPYTVNIENTQFDAVRQVEVTVYSPEDPEARVSSMRALLTDPAVVTR